MSSLLGTGAPVFSDAVLLFEVAAGVALIVGLFLVRAGHVRLHAYLQSSVVLVNLPVVLIWMVPSYLDYVLPGVPSKLGQAFYLLPTIMLAIGAAAEALGIYVLLVAGTNLVPERFRFRRYKLWMRTVIGLWWLVLAMGLLTYYIWYVSPTGSL
ncbi:MAG TPA: hypothetical protein VEL82_05510 [Thermoplasmata archaeon]|nr:hypothetical protein [Thermoplasmata archaeon]